MTTVDGRVVLVTGASSGIGAAVARLAAARGGHVAIVARRAARLEQLALEIRDAGGQARVFAADLTDSRAVAALAEDVRETLGVPHILINSAGAGAWRYIDETSPDEAVEMMAAPYFAAFYVTRALLPAMLQARSGTIVNLTSAAGHGAIRGATAYTAARWAMRGFSEALRQDLHGSGVSVALATFAKVETEYFATNEGAAERLPRLQAAVRVLRPEQAARAIIDGIERGAKTIVAPPELRLMLVLSRLIPGATRWLLRVTGHSRR